MPVAIVTGGSRGIGRAISVLLAESGFDVAINFLNNRKAAEETARKVEERRQTAGVFQANISIKEHGVNLVDMAMNMFGKIDILVNNAGIAPKERCDILESTIENYDEVLDTNLRGPYFLSQYVAKKMIYLMSQRKINCGRIVNIGSISSYTASSNRGEYCISKSGVSMMTKLFADRLAEHNITVNEIQPGIIKTDMIKTVINKYQGMINDGLTPIKRFGKPEDIGKAVVAIALGYFDFTTGASIPVDGGFHLHRL